MTLVVAALLLLAGSALALWGIATFAGDREELGRVVDGWWPR